MKIQHIILSGVSVLLFSVISGCSNYLDVVPDNDIETIETTFEKREGAYSWFKTCYSMITMDISDIMTCPAYWGTDEVVADDYIRLNNPTVMPGIMIADGLQMAQSPYGNVWKSTKFYGGIRYCNLFLDHIDGVYNMQQKEKDLWKAEIQALKAQYYFELMRRYPLRRAASSSPLFSPSPGCKRCWRSAAVPPSPGRYGSSWTVTCLFPAPSRRGAAFTRC